MNSIKINIYNTHCEIEGLISKSVENQFAVYVPGYKYSKLFKEKKWNGKKKFLSKNTFNTGLLELVLKVLHLERVQYELIDKRNIPSYTIKSTSVPLRDYQIEALQGALSNTLAGTWWARGTLRLPTGAGKTRCASAIMDTLQVPTLFLTHRIDLIDQTQKALKEFNIKAGVISAGKFDTKKRITIASIQSLMSYNKEYDKEKFFSKYIEDLENPDPIEVEMATDAWNEKLQKDNEAKEKIEEFLRTIEIVIVDEAHIITSNVKGAGLFNQALNLMPNAYVRLGLTATPDMKDQFSNYTAMGQTGSLLCDISSEELIDQGYLSPVKVTMYPMRGTIKAKDWPSVYDLGVVTQTARNQKIIDVARSEPGPTLILVSKVNHGSLLQSDLGCPFIFGEANLTERKALAKSLKNGSINLAIASTIWDEGIDIPNIRTIILAGGGKSAIKNLQRVGRGMRIADGKERLHVIDFFDYTHRILKNHSNERFKLWKDQGFEVDLKV